MIIEFNNTLFRYDIENPPADWDLNFKNHDYDFDKIGHKNKADFFFFTDQISIAESFGKEALSKANMKNKKEYYLT